MQSETPRHLHLMLNAQAMELSLSVFGTAFCKKYPGEHIALVGKNQEESARVSGFFQEIHVLDSYFIRQCATHPIIGDESAFHFFQKTLEPLVAQRWNSLFNLSGHTTNTALTPLFSATRIVGTRHVEDGTRCPEPQLKLIAQLTQAKMSNPLLERLLAHKALGQLDLSVAEQWITRMADLRQRATDPLKAVVLGYTDDLGTQKGLYDHLFTLVDLRGEEAESSLYVDAVLRSGIANHDEYFTPTINARETDYGDLETRIGEVLHCAVGKWICFSFLFDSLGNARLALAAEKIVSRFPHDILRDYLNGELGRLKETAKALLEEMRRPAPYTGKTLIAAWRGGPGPIPFACTLETSLHSDVEKSISNEQDLKALKNRLKQLNQFYERCYRATALEIPKTDLALTL